jgi:Outer membrane protein beta-barrel domain
MKFIAIAASMCLSITAGAQIHWAIKAGAQISGAGYKRAGEKITTNTVTGFNAGILGKIYFDDKVAFVTGFIYSSKGYKVKTLPGDTLKTYRLNYTEIPVMVQFDLSKTRGQGFYCKAGPSVGIGVSGKETYTGMSGMKVKNKVVLSMTGNHLGVFDASLNAALGYADSKRFFAEMAYAYGIGNINNNPDGPNIKSRVLSLSVGYFLR